MTSIEEKIQNLLFEKEDKKYKEFQCKLIPTVFPDTVIGVRTPEMRKIAKSLVKDEENLEFLKILPHKYYDENNLHGFMISEMKDFDRVVYELDRFLPYVDNWATCDLISPKIFKSHKKELFEKIKIWINSEDTYTVRFAIEMLMSHFLDEEFSPTHLEMVSKVKSEEYYINMIIAWYFATALAKQYDAAVKYIESGTLDKWCHNKTIQKAVESNRITDEQKSYLKTLKIK